MAEEFIWADVAVAAKEWMAEHPNEQPAWLLLPFDTNKEILSLAAEIYDTPTQRQPSVAKPTFVAEIPKIDHSALLKGPIVKPWDKQKFVNDLGEEIRHKQLVALAERGELTTQDIQMMSMEDYAKIRHILGRQVQQAIQGKPAGEIMRLFKKL